MAAIDYDAIVVGGGYSGVTSARDLCDRGLSVLLLEGSDRLGGRTFSRSFTGLPDIIECGGAWIDMQKHVNVRREVERYRIELAAPGIAPGSACFYTDGEARALPVPALELWAIEAAILRLHQAAARLTHASPVHEQPVSDLDVSAADFFKPLALPAATRDLVYALAGANAGAHPDDVSMLWLLGLIAGGGGSPFGFFMFSGSSHSYTYANGTQDLLKRMVEDSGTRLQLSTRVTGVIDDGSRVVVTTMDGTEHSAGACVMAVPTNVLRHIDFSPELDGDRTDLIAQNHPSRAYKVWIIADSIPPAPICVGMAPLQVILPFKQLEDGRCLLVGFGAEGIAPLNVHDHDEVENALRHYAPDAELIAFDAHDWGSDPLFDGTYRVDAPGKHQRTPLIMNDAHGRIVFAGGDIEQGLFRNTMEGSIVSGARAAVRAREVVRQ